MLTSKDISFDLPVPWHDKRFTTSHIGTVNYLVGPNGSGKSRFAESLKGALGDCRLLGTDRLRGLEKHPGMGFLQDRLTDGFQKRLFGHFLTAGKNYGFGIDTFILLERKLDLRVRVEATLTTLFARQILLDWDSGNLVPKAVLPSGGSAYKIAGDECHGIKELIVLLTHLYNDDHRYLIIDEPELHLHPQRQSFVMQQVRKIAGDPDTEPGKKCVFLITHSPFILDIRTMDDLQSIISFDVALSAPRHLHGIDGSVSRKLATLLPRLNASHKQLFFSGNPIFVEGSDDAEIVRAIQECRRTSVAAAGSCVIDAGGAEEVSKYLLLCNAFGKHAYFMFDLDSLFRGNLRRCIHNDETITDFLLELGLGRSFAKYCGSLDTSLFTLVKRFRDMPVADGPTGDFIAYLTKLSPNGIFSPEAQQRARIALLVQINKNRDAVVSLASGEEVREIEGRLAQVIAALREKNILLLPGGALEHYLPGYEGDLYERGEAAKRAAVEKEISVLICGLSDHDLKERYKELYDLVTALPSRPDIDLDGILKEYLSKYIHQVQNAIVTRPTYGREEVARHLSIAIPGIERLFQLEELVRLTQSRFSAKVQLLFGDGEGERFVRFSDETNAGMRAFEIEGP